MKTRRYYGGSHPEILKSDKISTQTTVDAGYKVAGVLTHTINSGISGVRALATNVSNFFGQSGFDVQKFNKAKQKGLSEIVDKLGANQKLIGLSIDVDNNEKLICIHFTGTVIERG